MGIKAIDKKPGQYLLTCDVCNTDTTSQVSAPRFIRPENLSAWAEATDRRMKTFCSEDCSQAYKDLHADQVAARLDKQERAEQAKQAFNAYIEENPDHILKVLEALQTKG